MRAGGTLSRFLFCAVLWSGGLPQPAGASAVEAAGSPEAVAATELSRERTGAESSYLVVIETSALGLLRQDGTPVIWKGADFIVAEWNERQVSQAQLRSVPFEIVARDLDDRYEIRLFELEDEGTPPIEWTDNALFHRGRKWLVAAEAAEMAGWGEHAQVHSSIPLQRDPRGWAPPAPLVAFSCGFDPLVRSLVDQTDEARWLDWIEKISGEETLMIGGEDFDSLTRYSYQLFPEDSATAFDFIVEQAEAWHYGPGDIEQDPFAGGSGQTWKNLILTIPGQTVPDEIVLLTAHFDSTADDTASTLAPGADDNGTGSATLLEAARLLRQFRFERTIKVVWFTGEEQGLIGSEAYVADHPTEGFLGVVNLDMIGYDGDDDRCFEMHVGTLPESLDVGNCFANSIQKYNLNLSYDFLLGDATDRSDHASFWQVDVGAIAVAENFFSDSQPNGCVGVDRNPAYHQNTDTIDNLAPGFGYSIMRATLATIAKMAVPIETCFAAEPSLTATSDFGSVDLAWSSVPDAASYRVYRSTQGCQGQWTELGQTMNTGWVDGGADHLQPYFYEVVAVGADGFCVSAESSCASATPLQAAPGEPDAMTVRRSSSGDLVIEWDPADAGCQAPGYAIYRGDIHDLRTTGYAHDTALVCASDSTAVTFPENDPRIGGADYFLAVSENGVDEGSYGRASSGQERPTSQSACRPTQDLGSCAP